MNSMPGCDTDICDRVVPEGSVERTIPADERARDEEDKIDNGQAKRDSG